MKAITKDFAQKIMRNYGLIDTKKYRYKMDMESGVIQRIALDALDTTAALSDKSESNPHGWETIEVK